jgi:hypothetical protein
MIISVNIMHTENEPSVNFWVWFTAETTPLVEGGWQELNKELYLPVPTPVVYPTLCHLHSGEALIPAGDHFTILVAIKITRRSSLSTSSVTSLALLALAQATTSAGEPCAGPSTSQ